MRHREGGMEDSGASAFAFGYWPTPDNIFAVADDADPTKILKFELTNLSPATVRTVTWQDADQTPAGLEIANVFTESQSIENTLGAELTFKANLGFPTGLVFKEGSTTKATIYNDHNAPGLHSRLTDTSDKFIWGWTGNDRMILDASGLSITPDGTYQDTLRVNHSDGNPRVRLGVYAGSTAYGGIWLGSSTPANNNFALAQRDVVGDPTLYVNAPPSGVIQFQVANARAADLKKWVSDTGFTAFYLGTDGPSADNYTVIRKAAATDPNTYWNTFTGGQHRWRVNNSTTGEMRFDASFLGPVVDAGLHLGGVSNRWGDIFTARNLFVKGTSVGTSGDGVVVLGEGTAPSSSPTDSWQAYCANWNGAGTGTPHFRNEEGHTIFLARGAALTTGLTTITHTAPGTPDYALQDLVDSSGGAAFGFATKDEGNTLLSVVANLQARVNELENYLQAIGALA